MGEPLVPVIVIMTTYLRTECAVATLKGLRENLIFDDIHWIIADDGSPPEHVEALKEVLNGCLYVDVTNAERKGVGVSKNLALKKAFNVSPVVLLLEDDWVLSRPFDITHDVHTLLNYEAVGMIRYGYLSSGTTMTMQGYGQVAYLNLHQHSCFWVYSGQVSLRHQRWYEIMGFHTEGCAPGAEEEEYCHRFSDHPNPPLILWRADTPVLWGPFKNVGFQNTMNAIQPETT